MPDDEPIVDNPTDWVADHIRNYVATSGAEGYLWRGVTTLLLTTRGRRTGTMRRTALIFGRDGDAYLVVASKGGADTHPQWYLNLVADPEVTIQVKGDVYPARARTATAEERERLWPTMTAIWPAYDDYEKKTTRVIPLVIIETE